MDNQRPIEGPLIERNVHGLERAGSIVGGLLLTRHGLHRGGLLGVWDVGLSATLLLRGLTGHCYVKEVLHDRRQALNQLRGDLERLQRAVDRLARNGGGKAPPA